jgi:hypothetical protein
MSHLLKIVYRRKDGMTVTGLAYYSYRRGPAGEWVYDGKPLAELDGVLISEALIGALL